MGAFHSLGQNGISNPAILSGSIGTVVLAPEIGMVVGIIGLSIILVTVIFHFATKTKPPGPNP